MAKHAAVFIDRDCCPHKSDDNCEFMKPEMHFIYKVCRLYNIDLSCSFIDGDHPSDIQYGLNKGISSVYLLIRPGQKHQNGISRETVMCANLLEAS